MPRTVSRRALEFASHSVRAERIGARQLEHPTKTCRERSGVTAASFEGAHKFAWRA
ncbi:hypothetical protein ACQPW1_12710 [Nocardia sp. CA-128927]|uniref:hypothetical protein n=1 Tax=Nocardia sp. CA-128927 TaxID=3239975 RepID=UPI003D97B6D7